MAPVNHAAWIEAKQQLPLVVREAPYTRPGPGQAVVKVAYCAMNPADNMIAKHGTRVTVYPNIIGQNVSGTVEEVGDGVTNVNVGDRVMAHVMGVVSQNHAEGAFQEYTVALAPAVCRIPEAVSLEEAVVLPLAISTAAVGMYMKNQLNLPLPQYQSLPKLSNKVLLVWGGSSSVGAVVIQMAVASGIRVATTCSPRNNAFVKSLGAEYTFNHSSTTVSKDIITTLKEAQLDLVGAYNTIANKPAGTICGQVVVAFADSPSNTKRVASVPPAPDTLPDGVELVLLGPAATMFTDPSRKDVAHYIWQEYCPKALETGLLKAVPEPLIVGEGLHYIEKALETLADGVSAKKVVVKVQ